MAGHSRLADAALATSEIVTNVIRHSPSTSHLEVTVACGAGGTVRIGVVQEADGFERPAPVTDAPHGRGLLIVDAVTDLWAVEAGVRTTVWFEVSE